MLYINGIYLCAFLRNLFIYFYGVYLCIFTVFICVFLRCLFEYFFLCLVVYFLRCLFVYFFTVFTLVFFTVFIGVFLTVFIIHNSFIICYCYWQLADVKSVHSPKSPSDVEDQMFSTAIVESLKDSSEWVIQVVTSDVVLGWNNYNNSIFFSF